MKEKLIRVCGKNNRGNYFVAGIVADENNNILQVAPILKKWIGKNAAIAYRQFKHRFFFELVEDKPVIYQDIYNIFIENHPILLKLVEIFDLDFC